MKTFKIKTLLAVILTVGLVGCADKGNKPRKEAYLSPEEIQRGGAAAEWMAKVGYKTEDSVRAIVTLTRGDK